MQAPKKTSHYFYNLVMGVSVLIQLAASGCDKFQENGKKKMGGPAASYEEKNMALFGANSLSIFSTGGSDGLADIYIEFPDGSRHFLPDVTDAIVAKHLEKMGSIDPNAQNEIYSDGLSRFEFRDGKLFDISLEAGLATWKLASKKEGPYLALPISKADLLAQFGEPDSWGVYEPPRGP